MTDQNDDERPTADLCGDSDCLACYPQPVPKDVPLEAEVKLGLSTTAQLSVGVSLAADVSLVDANRDQD